MSEPYTRTAEHTPTLDAELHSAPCLAAPISTQLLDGFHNLSITSCVDTHRQTGSRRPAAPPAVLLPPVSLPPSGWEGADRKTPGARGGCGSGGGEGRSCGPTCVCVFVFIHPRPGETGNRFGKGVEIPGMPRRLSETASFGLSACSCV